MPVNLDNAGQIKAIDPNIEALFEAGAHLGYSKSRQHPKMKGYVFGVRNNIEIFDLVETDKKIKEAEAFLRQLGKEKKLVLFVGAKASAREYIEEAAKAIGMPFVKERWLGGTLTNLKIIDQRLQYMERLEKEAESGELEKYVKKERMQKLVELRKLLRMFSGIRSLKILPAAVFVVDPAEEKTAVSEARRKNIPIISILNSDCNPTGIKYPIPANDSAGPVIKIILDRLVAAYKKGVETQAQDEIRNSEAGVLAAGVGKTK